MRVVKNTDCRLLFAGAARGFKICLAESTTFNKDFVCDERLDGAPGEKSAYSLLWETYAVVYVRGSTEDCAGILKGACA
jgi:hypothetical protein